MSSTIKVTRLHDTSDAPSILDMAEGSIAINTQTGKIYAQNDNLEVIEIGGLYNGVSLPRSDPQRRHAFWNDNGTLKVSLFNA
jgi:hypothetical protein